MRADKVYSAEQDAVRENHFDDFSRPEWQVLFGLLISEPPYMKEIIEHVMRSTRTTEIANLSPTELRSKVGGYVELLSSTGKRDPEELIHLGIAYLDVIINGPDSRYTGC
ncbi:MAG TPA: hypothetical protein VHB49_13770 [Bradyrhizobium sp.]|nr:hypothetical protein [Bradyrhizobium sp.]